jgi:hypothetical protein
MYLMSRSAQLTGDQGLAWARSMRDLVTETAGHEVQLWARTLSPGFGTVSWTSWWEDLPSMETAFAKLVVDAKYMEKAFAGREFVTGEIDDSLAETVTELSSEAGNARYVGSVSATLAVGNGVRGVMAGIEIASRINAIAGTPSVFCQRHTGPYGGVTWFTAFESLAQYQEASAKLAADPDFITYVDSTKGCFVEGSGEQLLWVKID